MTVEAIAAAGMQFNAEQPDRLAIAQLRRVISNGLAGEMQMLGSGECANPGAPSSTLAHGRPSVSTAPYSMNGNCS